MTDARTVFLLFHAVLGVALGTRSPAKGLAVLVAVIATTASLSWHLGLGNLPANHLYLLGLLTAASARALIHNRDPGVSAKLPYALRVSIALVFLTFLGSMLVAIFRVHLPRQPTPGLAFQSVLQELLTYSPSGIAGLLQSTYVALIGPAVLLLSLRYLQTERDRTLFRNAFLGGLALAVVSPVVQFLAFDAWARPDLGLAGPEVGDLVGLSGLFHDPHSYAPYLALGIGVALGASLGWNGRGNLGRAAAASLLASMSFVVLLYTNSRSGLLVAVLTLCVLLAQTWAHRRSQRTSSAPRWVRVTSVVVMLSIVFAGALLFVSPSLQQSAYEQLIKLGNPRMWELLRSDVDIRDHPSLYFRLALAEKAWTLTRSRPVWGVGPNGFYGADVPLSRTDGTPIPNRLEMANAHNYYLQIAAEYGVPALASFLLLVALTLTTIARAAWRCAEPLQRGILAGIASGQVGFLAFLLVAHPLLLAEVQAVYWSLAGLGIAIAVHGNLEQPAKDVAAARAKSGSTDT